MENLAGAFADSSFQYGRVFGGMEISPFMDKVGIGKRISVLIGEIDGCAVLLGYPGYTEPVSIGELVEGWERIVRSANSAYRLDRKNEEIVSQRGRAIDTIFVMASELSDKFRELKRDASLGGCDAALLGDALSVLKPFSTFNGDIYQKGNGSQHSQPMANLASLFYVNIMAWGRLTMR